MPSRMAPRTVRLMRLLATLAVVGLSVAACFEIDAFECGSDDGCVRDGTAGRCEAGGVCAYPNDACDSGWRYSPNAGSLAEMCVPPEGEADTDVTGGTSTGTVPASSSSESSSGGEGSPSCAGCERVKHDGRSFFVCATPTTWFDARDACIDCGLRLASVHSPGENDALAERVPGSVQLWIGFSDRDIEETWTWVDGSEVDFEAWSDPEPSSLAEDDCGALVASGEWLAKRCDLPNPYACALAP